MDNSSSFSPDLQSILAALARSAQQTAPQTPEQNAPTKSNAPSPSSVYYTPQEESQSRPVSTPKPIDPRLRPQTRAPTASPKPIDPATITTWQDGLRCVTKIAAQNVEFAASLRKMMQDQRAHEMRWYSERQSLKNVQANRASSAAKAQSILQVLGGGFTSQPGGSAPEVDKEDELAEFDRKVHAAQQAMETAMTAELKGLGVPFFGTDHKLVVPDGGDISTVTLSEDHPKWSPVVTETQLLDLRRKMICHLEDLYRD